MSKTGLARIPLMELLIARRPTLSDMQLATLIGQDAALSNLPAAAQEPFRFTKETEMPKKAKTKEPELCASCEKELPEVVDWFGESGKPYCSEDCMNDCDDAPEED